MLNLEYTAIVDLLPRIETALCDRPDAVMTGWTEFDRLLGGLRPNELTLFCAPTGAGKTQWLASLAANLLQRDIPTYVASVETGDIDFGVRVLSALEGYDFNSTIGNLPHEKVRAVFNKHLGVLKNRLYLAKYENRVDVNEMINYLRYVSQEHGVRVAMLDNLNFFLRVSSSTMEKAEMDQAIHEFVMLAKELPMHIILVCHPKKTDNGKVVSEFDIKGSSTAVQEAANVLLFNRTDYSPYQRDAVFKKCRKRGAVVNHVMKFDYAYSRYRESK